MQLVYTALSFRPANGEKIFHYLFIVNLLAGTIAYYAEGSGLAYSVVEQHLYVDEAATFQVFYAKYIYWVVSFPTIILALGLVSGVSWATIVFNIFLAWVWVVSYLASAYTATVYKWGFYTFGTVAYVLLAFQTLWAGRSAALRLDVAVAHHTILSGFVNLLWLLYPIAFALADGGNYLSVTESLIFFGVLDVLLVLGTAFGFLWFSRGWDYGRLNLHFTQYGRVATSSVPVHPEKGVTAAEPAAATV